MAQQLLFTTEDMGAAAAQLGEAAGDLLARVGTLSAFGVLMPPAVEIEVAETTASVAAVLTESSWFYGANAVDLADRTAMVIAENEVTSIGAGLRALVLRLSASAVDGVPVFERLAGEFGSKASEFYERASESVGDVTGWLGTESFFVEHTAISVLEDAPALEKGILSGVETLANSDAFKMFGNAMNGVGALAGGYQAWEDTAGEVTVARGFTAATTTTADFVINRYPVTAGANFLSGGALQADADIIVQIGGGFISGGPKEAMQQWDNAADEAANGQFGTPVKMVSEAVNWAVEKAYGPVSNIVGPITDTVSSTEHSVTHLARRVGKDLENIF